MRRGFTIIEVLISTTLTLLLIGAIAKIFGSVGEGINTARGTLEMCSALRDATSTLERDLEGVTVTTMPPQRYGGYFEVIEGPADDTPGGPKTPTAHNEVGPGGDATVGDVDDILMFTTRSANRPFQGSTSAGSFQSELAEVVWFLRGNKLYRRTLLIKPGYPGSNPGSEDISASKASGSWKANSLDELCDRKNRYGHAIAYPHDSRGWGVGRMPALGDGADSSSPNPSVATIPSPFDYWYDSCGATGARAEQDVILTNVLSFDVKVLDPDANGGAGAYVDLGKGAGRFGTTGEDSRSKLAGGTTKIYDTWFAGYENDGIAQGGGKVDPAADGIDDNNRCGPDDEGENETFAPYPYPLRGIQVTIRVFDVTSGEVRELVVSGDFAP